MHQYVNALPYNAVYFLHQVGIILLF